MSFEGGEENLRNSIVYVKDGFYLCNFAEEYLYQSLLKGLILYVEVEGAVLAMKGFGKFCGMCISAEPESPFKVGYFYVPERSANNELYEKFVEGGEKVFQFKGATQWNNLREQEERFWTDTDFFVFLELIRANYEKQLKKPEVYDKEALRFGNREYFRAEQDVYLFRELVSFYNQNIAGFVDSITEAIKRGLGKFL